MNEWILSAANVGVPAALCFFILLRVDQTMAKLTEAITKLSKIVSHCAGNDYPKYL